MTVRELADRVLPLVRTRKEMHHRGAANEHGRQMHEAVDLLEAQTSTTDPAELHRVTHKALASAITVIARADDSSGIIGDACRRLLALHPQTAAAARVRPRTLVDWMMKFQFEGEVDFFELDPVAYAPALGEQGMATYRARLEEVRASLGPAPEAERWSVPHRHERWVLHWNDRRLAVLDHDHEAIVRTHAKDRRVAAWYQDTAEAFAEIGETDLAIAWARDGLDMGSGHQSLQVAEYWCGLLEQHRPDELGDARLLVFRRWPSSTTAARLHRAAGERWPEYRDEVLDMLSASPREAALFALLTLQDSAYAWHLAHILGLDDDRTWSDLVQAHEKIDPLAVLPVHQRLVEHALIEADAKNYRNAARRLARMRQLAAGADRADDVDELIARLREEHRRRPRLQREFDRAGLP